MNKRNKYAAKFNINTKKRNERGMPDPSTTSPQAKTRNRRLTMARAQRAQGRGQVSAEMDKAMEVSIPDTGACPAQHWVWSTLRFAESCKS
ncbi:hypothetical protein HanIR_Chr05g0237841 [Helianthus annuus]|nr:hypothetical protein HanIR_Chr05g0237841 [Helianthus annuus]